MYSLMSKFYSEIFPLTLDKLSFAQRLNHSSKSNQILDIGCSTGDLSLALAKESHQVTGIDLDEEMIAVANSKKSEFPELDLHYEIMDMLTIGSAFPEKKFHQVLCFGNTIVHLTELNQIYSLFSQVASILNTTGIFKGQILNYSYIMANKVKSLPIIENESIRFERNYTFDNSIIHFQTILKDKKTNTKHKHSIPLYPLSYNILDELLHDAGFQNVKYYGNFNLDPFTEESYYLVFEAQK